MSMDTLINRVAQSVADYYHVPVRELTARSRFVSVTIPRHVCMYLLREVLGMKMEAIAIYFDERDHTIAVHGNRLVRRRMARDTVFAAQVSELTKRVQPTRT